MGGVHGKIEYDRGVLRRIKYVWSYLAKLLFLRRCRRLLAPFLLRRLLLAPFLLDGGQRVGLKVLEESSAIYSLENLPQGLAIGRRGARFRPNA